MHDSSGTADNLQGNLSTAYWPIWPNVGAGTGEQTEATNIIVIRGYSDGSALAPVLVPDFEPEYYPLRWGPVAWGWICQLRAERRRAPAPMRAIMLPRHQQSPRRQLYHNEGKRRRLHRAGVSAARLRRR